LRSAERIIHAAQRLASRYPFDKITFADVAKEAGVHWTTVQRYFGSKEAMRSFLEEQQAAHPPSLADTRTRILEAARRVFARSGYEGATLDQVGKEAGLTKGAVYWHFASKSDLYLALCDHSLMQLLAGLPEQLEGVLTSADPREALRQLLAAQFLSCEADKGEKPMLFFEFIARSREPEVKEKLSASVSKLLEGTSRLLREMQERGLLAGEVDPDAMAVSLHALVNGIVLMWVMAPNRVPFQALAGEAANLIWNGIRPQKP
jgi:AcrR family transcriptional regulator